MYIDVEISIQECFDLACRQGARYGDWTRSRAKIADNRTFESDRTSMNMCCGGIDNSMRAQYLQRFTIWQECCEAAPCRRSGDGWNLFTAVQSKTKTSYRRIA